MLKFKKIISFIMASVLTLTGFNGLVLANDIDSEQGAYAIIGNANKYYQLTIVNPFDEALQYTTVSYDGKSGWKMQPTSEIVNYVSEYHNKAMYFKLTDSYISNVQNYKNFEIEVEYYDEADGRFRILYDALPDVFDTSSTAANSIDKSEVVYTEGTNKWKTHKFTIHNARFNNGYQNETLSKNCDFAIAFYEEAMGVSEGPVTIRKIIVRPKTTTAGVQAKLTSDNIGNNFFSNENVIIKANLKNVTTESHTVNGEFVAYDIDGNLAYTTSFTQTVGAGATEIVPITIGKPKYSIYKAYLTLTGEGIEHYSNTDFAYIVKTDKKNQKMGMGSHSMRLPNRDYTKLVPLMNNVGFAHIRDGIIMDETFQPSASGAPGRQPPFAFTTHHNNVRTAYQNAGMKHLINIASEWMFTPGGMTQIDDPTNENLLLTYVAQLAATVKNQGNYYETMNEFNMLCVPGNASLGYSINWYIKMLKQIYTTIKAQDTTAKIVAGATSYIDPNFLGAIFSQAQGYFDEISVHPYTFTTGPDEAFGGYNSYYDHMKSLRDQMNSYNLQSIPIRVTEIGWSTAKRFNDPAGTHTEKDQAAYMAQIYAIYQNPELNISTTYFYDFIDDRYDYTDVEGQLGFIKHWDVVDTPYLAKPVLLSISWLNETLTDASFVSRNDTADYHIYEFARTDGQHVVMGWNKPTNSRKYTTYNISDTSAKAYDMYGNELEVMRNGTQMTVPQTNAPVYIIGNFSGYEIHARELFSIPQTTVNLTCGADTTFTINRTCGDDFVVDFKLPQDSQAYIKTAPVFSGSAATATIFSQGNDGSTEYAHLTIKTPGGAILYETDIALVHEYIEAGKTPIMTVQKLVSGTTLDFDDEFEFNDNCIIHSGDNHGGVLELRKGGTGIICAFDLGEQITSGTVKIGADLKIEPNALISLFSQYSYNEGYVGFDTGNLMVWNTFNTWALLQYFSPNVYYPEGEWFRFDMVIDLDNYTEKYYINGSLAGTSTFDDNSANGGHGILQNLYFYSDRNNGMLIDNVTYKKSNKAELLSAKYTTDGMIEATFTGDITLPVARSFTITGTSPENVKSTVSVAIDSINENKLYIKPGDMNADYTYTLSIKAGEKGADGVAIPAKTVDIDCSELTNDVDILWSFDDGVIPDGYNNAGTTLINDENKGKYFEYGAPGGVLHFQLGQHFTSGKYIYSMDVNPTALAYFRVWDGGQLFDMDFLIYEHLRELGKTDSGYMLETLKPNIVPYNKWTRIDHVLDIDNMTNSVFIDGKYYGELDMNGRTAMTDRSYVFGGISAFYFSDDGGDNRLQMDNVRFKSYTDTFEAKATYDDGRIIIDFDETVPQMNEDDFILKKSASPLETPSTEVAFSFEYVDSTRAILRPSSARAGEYFEITCTAKSFLGHSLKDDTIACVVGSESAPAISEIKFFDIAGNSYYAEDITIDTAKVEITLPYGLQEGSESITFTSNNKAVSYTKEWNEAEKKLTLYVTSALATSRNCKLTLAMNSANGVAYTSITDTFRAGTGKTKFAVNSIELQGDSLNVHYGFANNTTTETKYTLIFAGYKEGRLVTMDMQDVSLLTSSTNGDSIATFTSSEAKNCDRIIVYVWDGINTMVPILQDTVEK